MISINKRISRIKNYSLADAVCKTSDNWEVFKYIPSESLEGYLYPDTYLLLKDTSNEVVVERMLNRFEEQVLPFWRTAAQETKYNLHAKQLVVYILSF